MEEKTKKIIDIIFKIVIVIIIIILLIHNCVISKKTEEPAKGIVENVDIIEITCDKQCKIPIDDGTKETTDNTNKQEGNNKQGENNNQENNNKPDDKQDNPTEEENNGELEVFDNDKDPITWNGSKELRIFNNSTNTKDDVIAPESTNTYKFIVRNSTTYKLKYKIDFIEDNPSNINMKYKLKKNDTYVVDHFVSYAELNIENQIINANSEDTFYLEWKWVSNDNDTEIGINGANYKLSIEINAEGYNG